MMGSGWGVAIVSKYPMRALGPETIDDPASDHPVRAVGAVVQTPEGDVAVTSVHLKCCGTKSSAEDSQRVIQAELINRAMDAAYADAGAGVRVIAGDFNLVGVRGPLDSMRAGLAPDGSDLSVARTETLGANALYTWWEAGNRFPPGRLDYLLYGGARAVNAFTLDTARLSDAALARLGLYRDDSRASDHLPMVVDLIPD